MSDEKRKEQERNRALVWLNQKAPSGFLCQICGNKQWTIGDMVELRPYEGGNLTLGGGTFPAMQVVCANCGNTLLVNAVLSGVVRQADYQSNEGKADA